jgi:hypothetical protein
MEENLLSLFMKIFVLFTTPITFFVGILLLFDFDTYLKLEKFLSKSYFKPVWKTRLNKSKDSLHLFLISKRRVLGIICLLNTIAIILANFRLFKKM